MASSLDVAPANRASHSASHPEEDPGGEAGAQDLIGSGFPHRSASLRVPPAFAGMTFSKEVVPVSTAKSRGRPMARGSLGLIRPFRRAQGASPPRGCAIPAWAGVLPALLELSRLRRRLSS